MIKNNIFMPKAMLSRMVGEYEAILSNFSILNSLIGCDFYAFAAFITVLVLDDALVAGYKTGIKHVNEPHLLKYIDT